MREFLLRLHRLPWVWAIIFLGVALRVAYYLRNDSLWLDESYVADNAFGKTPMGMLGTLLYGQSAPVPFMWLEQLCVGLMGHNEYAVRFWPVVAGILAMLGATAQAIWWRPSRVFVYTTSAVWALSEPLILYSSQAKQYSTDVLFAVALWSYFIWVQRRDTRPWWEPVLYFTAVISSFPAVFLIVAFAMVEAYGEDLWRGVRLKEFILKRWRGYLATTIAFVLLYAIQARQYAFRSDLMQFWDDSFLPHDARAPLWLILKAWELCGFPLGMYFGWVALPLLVYGFLVIPFRQRLLVGAVLMIGLFVSALHVYPFQGRVVLYLAPFLVPVVACGVEGVGNLAVVKKAIQPSIRGWLLFTLVVFLMLDSLTYTLPVALRTTPSRMYVYGGYLNKQTPVLIVPEQAFRPLLAKVMAYSLPGDGYLVHPSATPQVEAYQCILGKGTLKPDYYFLGTRGVGRFEFREGDPVYGRIQNLPWKRMWLIASVEDKDLKLPLLAPRWHPVARVDAPGVTAVLLQ